MSSSAPQPRSADRKPRQPPTFTGLSSRSGTEPPREHRWKPGQSGNPRGRASAGATLREWINVLAAQSCTEAQLRRIARNGKLPWPKRAAAERILRTLEAGDLADMDPFLRGDQTLDQLREGGVNTDVVKRCRTKVRVTVGGEKVVEREIELHDRGGEAFDRIVNHTDGRPTERIVQHFDGTLRTPAQGAAEAADLLARIRDRLGVRAAAG
jgi:hypothetical protein